MKGVGAQQHRGSFARLVRKTVLEIRVDRQSPRRCAASARGMRARRSSNGEQPRRE
jgi:hypothetical protein